MRKGKVSGVIFLSFISVLLMAQSVPQLINYQGRLADDTGLPIDGTREMRFRLLDADTLSASVLWSETQSNVQVDNGIYHIMLGSVNPIPPSAISQADIFLEVIVAGEILRPRSQVTSVPFAHKAASMPDSAITSAMISDGTITGSDIDSQTITSSNISDGTITSTQIQDNSITASDIQDVFVLNSGDTVTGTLQVNNGAYMYGSPYGAYGAWSNDPANNFGYVGASNTGVYGRAGNPGATGSMRGGYFESEGAEYARGLYGIANSYGDLSAIGVVGLAYNYSTGLSYGGYFSATEGTGTHIGIRADGDGYAGWFQDGPVHVGDGGTEDYVDGDGDLYVEDELEVDGDASFGGNIGIGRAPSILYGVVNSSTTAPGYGAYLYGLNRGVYGAWRSDPDDHYAYIGSQLHGIYTITGNSDETGNRYGGYFLARTQDNARGVWGNAWGYGVDAAHGIYGYGRNESSGDAYGGYFRAATLGTGTHYGVYAYADGYAGWFEGGPVHIGDAGVEDYAALDGDLYVEDKLEVDGDAYFSGGFDAPDAVDSSDIADGAVDSSDIAAGAVMAVNIGEDCQVGQALIRTETGWQCEFPGVRFAWTWMSGSDSIDQYGVYGTVRTPAPANVPGARYGAVSWTDSSGNLLFFGGNGGAMSSDGYLNDLWRWDGTYWTWMKGNRFPDMNGVYGTKGLPELANVPGCRAFPTSWIDASDNLWLFGGAGYGESGTYGYLNDLWMWDGLTNWTWMSGDTVTNQNGVYGTKGTPNPANVPGTRYKAVSWTDSSGNFWLFGGTGYPASGSYGRLNDLWRWDGANWTWISGSDSINQNGVYGTKGTPAPGNIPGGRVDAVSWTDSSGNFWLFGGYGYAASGGEGTLNDLWRWDGANWTWMSGSDVTSQKAVYGTKGIPAPSNVPGALREDVSWIDSSDNLWLFGGEGYDTSDNFGRLNDLWRWDGTNWTWMSGGGLSGQYGFYGTRRSPGSANIPGCRDNAVSWIDSSGDLWLFGGRGYPASGSMGWLNDLWKYDP